ncbi:50S ribosomal protein L9 [Patescibacteria group bacterium]|nr:50S ribosomal protein L9 [Patescibacteria group bacterium]
MKIILLQDVLNMGKRYDVKNVSDGYARNFLLPRKLAMVATTQNLQNLEKRKKIAEEKKEKQKKITEENLAELNNKKISISAKSNEKGNLFKGITKQRISEILKEKENIEIAPELIELEKPIKQAGEHEIKIANKKFTLLIS